MADANNQLRIELSKKTNQIMLVIFFVALIFIFVIAFTGETGYFENQTANLNWNEGWLLPDGTELSFPHSDKNSSSLTIHNNIPETVTENSRIVFSSGYQPIFVEIDGSPVDVIGTFDEGSFNYATAYSHVALTPEMAGKEISVTYLNEGGKQWIELYSIELGNFNLIKQAAFEKDSLTVISSTVLLVISVLIFVLGSLQHKSAIQVLNNHTQNFLLASEVAIMFSLWMLIDTETVTLLFGHNPAYVFVNLFSYLFIMGPWLMQIILTTGKKSMLFRLLAMSGLLETAVIMVAAIFGIFDFSTYLTTSHLVGVGVEGSILFLSFEAFRQRRDLGSKLLFAAGIFLAVTSSIAAYNYYFAVSPNNVSFMKYGLFGYIVVMLYDLFSTFEKINQRYVHEVEAARLAAEEANKAKSDFLSSMSHDIRTPMNAIMGLTTIASANIDNKETVRESLRKITLSSRHLLGLINDILDMSKIESGNISLSTEELSLRELMENLLNIIQPQIRSRRQKFDVFIEDISSENVYCDGVRLNQILLNLLSNAVKFTKEEGSISVTLRQKKSPRGDKWVRTNFIVTDTGIGMSPEFIEHIFDRFTRADDLHVHTTEGSGLGMSITKHIVDMMDGSIRVESSPGEGSSFYVTLDFERVTQKEQSRVLPPWNTLVVDDDKQLCLSAAETLREMGIKADWTLSGKEAVEIVDKESRGLKPYHLVLLDWQMPDMDGIETARKIRERVGAGVPILLITAYDWSEIEQEALEAGINGFLSKPLFESTLRSGLLHYIGDEEGIAEPEKESGSDYTGRRILVAEDDDINWEIDEEILTEKGFAVERAENGLECFEKFKNSEPGYYDIILMDIRMPNMNGYQSAEAIRSLEKADAASVPILAMTADAFSEDVQHCLEVGMNGHIAKPLDFKTLLRLIKTYVKPKDIQ